MAKLGSRKNPLMLRTQTKQDADEVLLLCEMMNLKALVEINPNLPEDIFDLAQKIYPDTVEYEGNKIGRNEICPCGSGRKYKKCCLNLENTVNP